MTGSYSGENNEKDRTRYVMLIIGVILGLIAAFMQTIEGLMLANKDVVLPCSLNDTFSCSAVLDVRQSSLFGSPNSLICIMIFTPLLSIGIVAVTKSRITRKFLYGVRAVNCRS